MTEITVPLSITINVGNEELQYQNKFEKTQRTFTID